MYILSFDYAKSKLQTKYKVNTSTKQIKSAIQSKVQSN